MAILDTIKAKLGMGNDTTLDAEFQARSAAMAKTHSDYSVIKITSARAFEIAFAGMKDGTTLKKEDCMTKVKEYLETERLKYVDGKHEKECLQKALTDRKSTRLNSSH